MLPGRQPQRITLLLMDERLVVRAGLRHVLATEPDLLIVAEGAGAAEITALVSRVKPTVVVTDFEYTSATSYSLLSLLQEQTGSRILAFTDDEDWSAVNAFMQSGGAGYLPKRASKTEIIKAIRQVAAGRNYISPLLRRPKLDVGSGDDKLSARELEVVKLTSLGYTGTAIADQLSISRKTVETHKARAAHKMGFKNRADLVRYALERGLLKPK